MEVAAKRVRITLQGTSGNLLAYSTHAHYSTLPLRRP